MNRVGTTAVRGWICVFAVCAAPAAVSLAQPATPSKGFAQVRFGALTLAPTIRFTNIGIDGNVFRTGDSVRLPADFTATVTPGVEARVSNRRLALAVDVDAALVYYRRYVHERSINPTIRLDGRYRVSSALGLRAEGRAGYSRERSGFEIDSRPRLFATDAEVGVQLGERRLQFDLSGARTERQYTSSATYAGVRLGHVLDRLSHRAALAVTTRPGGYTSVGVAIEQQWDRFHVATDRDMDVTRGLLRLDLGSRAARNGHLHVGYLAGDPRHAEVPRVRTVVGSAGFMQVWRDRLSISLGAQRDLDFSYHADSPHFLFELFEASVRQALFHRFDIGVGGSRTTLIYRPFLGQPAPDREVLESAGASFGIRLARQSRVGLYVERWRRLGGPRSFEGYRTGLQLAIGRLHLSERGVFVHGVGR